MISFELDAEQQLIQETVRGFAKDELTPALRTAERERAPTAAMARGYAELGLRHLDLPESHGGQGASLITTMLAEEELGWGDPSLALALDRGYAGELAIVVASDEKARARLAPRPSTVTALAYAEP